MANMKNTTQKSGARGTKLIVSTGVDKSGLMKQEKPASPSMGGSRSNLDHTLKC